jgi:ubiquinone/menaquinone biosynthesis C-methylase UbiE
MLKAMNDTRFWDRAAAKYANDPIKDMAGYNRTVERTRQLLKPSDTVLEIGCGTGTTALSLAPFVTRLAATDVSGEMIAIAREKADKQFCINADFDVAAASALPAADNTYDAALAFNVLHLIADQTAALAEIFRTLKPGGLFITKTPCLSEMNPLIRFAVPVMRLIGKAPFVSSFTAYELECAMADAGFIIIDRERHGSGSKDARIFLTVRKPNDVRRPSLPTQGP